MYKEQRLKPLTILCYEALFRELKEVYRSNKVISQDYGHHLKGYLGEKQVDYKISISSLKGFKYYKGLRLKHNNNFFQIDSVLLSTKFILLLEIKNWKGQLTYHPETNHIVQTYQNVTKSYQNPILQVQDHEIQLMYWLQDSLGINSLPIYSFVVISDSSTLLQNEKDPYFYKKVIYADNLNQKLKELNQTHHKNAISKSSFQSIHHAFLQLNKPLHPDLIKKYNITKEHLTNGIECEQCGHYPMHRYYKTWQCESCSHRNPIAHKRKILDYFLLQQSSISNRECRELLQTDSETTAYTILKSMNLKQTGKFKASRYHAPLPEQYPQDSYIPSKKKSVFTLN